MTNDDRGEARLNEEVQFHIDMQTERNVEQGMPREEARRQALMQFGGRDRWKDEARAVDARPLAGMLADAGFALRGMLHHRGFAITAVLTLALGIGATTAIFSVVNAVLLRPLPYANADRLALIWGDMRARKVFDFPFSPPNYKDLKAENTTFEDIASVTPGNTPFTVPGETPERVVTSGVTPNFLSLLGARVALGRDFTEADATPLPEPPPPAPGAPPVAPPPPPPVSIILNHAFWQRRFGGDSTVVGRTVDLGGAPGTIIGVLEPGFEVLFPPNVNIPASPDILATFRINYETASRNNVFMRLVGRLKPGVTTATATQDVERIVSRLREEYPIMKTADTHWRVEGMHDDLVTDVRDAIFALMGAVVFVLLIACANVANLLLVRAAARERELAIRVALGSSPWRITRQLLTESLVLAAAGALVGLAIAWAGIRALVALAPANLPRLGHVAIDPMVLGFASLAALVAALIFGLVPAIRAARPAIADVLRSSGRTPGLGGGSMLRNGVVVAEVALSFVLLVGGGLMVRSFVELTRTKPGFDSRGLLTFTIGGRGGRTDEEEAALVRRMRERLSAIPGVAAATAMTPLPLDGQTLNSRWGTAEAVTDPSKFQQANLHIVIPGYFETMGGRVIAGRTFRDDDNRPDVLRVIIDQTMAAKAFPGQDPIGKQLYARTRGAEPEFLEVIGVVEPQRHESLTLPEREAIYLPDGFFSHGAVGTWAVRARCTATGDCDPSHLATAVRQVVREIDPQAPVAAMQPMARVVERAMTPTRFALVLIGAFGAVAALLAAVGLYGVLSTAVRQRTAEIGVRMAFGASARSVFGLVIGNGLKLSVMGLAIGVVAAFWLTRAMASMLVGVKSTDPLTYGAIVVLFLLIATLACWIPARRAAGLDPGAALRG